MKLEKKENFNPRKLLLLILDGVGVTSNTAEMGNAVSSARLPNLENLWLNYPTLKLKAHGKAVGMPSDSDMGNSEVGHNTLGSGRVFAQGAKLVDLAFEKYTIFQSDTWKNVVKNVKDNNSTLHFLGLLSDGNVHSHVKHLNQLLIQSKKEGIKKVRVHILLDGRDVEAQSSLRYIKDLENLLIDLNDINFDSKIASGGGRMLLTMDRYEADWPMIHLGWKTHVLGEGPKFDSAKEAIEFFREKTPDLNDQYIPPFVIEDNKKEPVGKIKDKDVVVLFNFRGDRAIEISRAFTEENFDKFPRGKKLDIFFAGMMQYDGDTNIPSNFLVAPPKINGVLTEYMLSQKISQYAISETQKFGHVTFFWNGNRSGYFDENLEKYVEIPSFNCLFDEKPQMRAREITEHLVEEIQKDQFDFYRANFPNGDMVGHTGNFEATVFSLEVVDECVGKLKKLCKEKNIALFVTADHGNSDEMYQLDKDLNIIRDSSKKPVPKTSHTLNPVYFTLYDPLEEFTLNADLKDLGLANVTASILDIMGYKPPKDYEKSLLKKK